MKRVNAIVKYSAIILMITFVVIFYGCENSVTDFGFDSQINGKIIDQSGNIVSADITTADFRVMALGEGESEPMRIRVQGDGSYSNTHLYPQSYTVWVEGPVEAPEEVTIDLSDDNTVQHDINVTPFLTIPPPETVGSVSSNEVSISYEIMENAGYVSEERVVYASTVPYPSESTGSGPYWHTIEKSLEENQDSVTIKGLEGGNEYHIRIAARAEGTNQWNHSDQIIVNTP